ncbi:MAG: asparagine synthase-related protein, partial [Nitrospinota bacterium]
HLDPGRRRGLLSRRVREALAEAEAAGREKAGEAPGAGGDAPDARWREACFRGVTRVDVDAWLLEDLVPTFAAAVRPAGLAPRLPFCDRALMGLALRLPYDWKVRGFRGKRVLRRAVRPWVPDDVLRRGRQGFTQPLGRWFRGPWKAPARRRLVEGAEGSGMLDAAAVRSLWEAHQSGREDLSSILWGLIVLTGWASRYSDVG